MKKTLVTLLALAGVASAATGVKVSSTTPYIIPSDGTEYQINFAGDEGTGLTYEVVTEGDVKVSKTDAYNSNNLAGATIKLTLGGTMTVSDHWGNNLNKGGLTYEYDFGTVGQMVASDLDSGHPITFWNNDKAHKLSATLSSDELSKLDNRENVSRALITVGYFDCNATGKMTLTEMSNGITLNIKGANLLDGGSLFSVTTNNGTTYYNLSDVTMSGNYATVKADAQAVELAYGTLYTVFGATASSGASIKTISYLATAIPEPTTATLSLLALCGLAARRRRH